MNCKSKNDKYIMMETYSSEQECKNQKKFPSANQTNKLSNLDNWIESIKVDVTGPQVPWPSVERFEEDDVFVQARWFKGKARDRWKWRLNGEDRWLWTKLRLGSFDESWNCWRSLEMKKEKVTKKFGLWSSHKIISIQLSYWDCVAEGEVTVQ